MFTSSTIYSNSTGNTTGVGPMTGSITANRPATGLRSANYTGYSAINGSFYNQYNLRSSYLSHTSYRAGVGGPNNTATTSQSQLRFDPLNQRNNPIRLASSTTGNQLSRDPLAAIISKERHNIYDKMRQLERLVHELVESSCLVATRGEYQLALIKAKDAQSKMNALKSMHDKNITMINRHRNQSAASPGGPSNPLLINDGAGGSAMGSQSSAIDQLVGDGANKILNQEASMVPMTNGVNINEDIIMVNTNLALRYLQTNQLQKALEIYNQMTSISNNNGLLIDQTPQTVGLVAGAPTTANSGGTLTCDRVAVRFGINLANEYFRQEQYQRALKYYRLTLDRISSNDCNNFRIKIMCNISLTFIKSKQYLDAITSYNNIISDNINMNQKTINMHHHQCCIHLLICNYIIKDRDSMKAAYQKLVDANLTRQFDDLLNSNMDDMANDSGPSADILEQATSLAPTNSKSISEILFNNVTTGNTLKQTISLNQQQQEHSFQGLTKGKLSAVPATGGGMIMTGRSGAGQDTSTPLNTARLAKQRMTSTSVATTTTRYSSSSDIISTASGSILNVMNGARSVVTKGAADRQRLVTPTEPIDDLHLERPNGELMADVSNSAISFVRSAIRNDPLHKLIKTKFNQVQRSIIMGAKLIAKLDDAIQQQHCQRANKEQAPGGDFRQQIASTRIENNSQSNKDTSSMFSPSNNKISSKQPSADISRLTNTISNNLSSVDDGLSYCISLLQNSKHFHDLTSDLEISKATRYIEKQQFDQAIETLKMMEANGKANQNSRSSSMAATNLSLLYSLKYEFTLASNYAEQAISIDPYNANAYVNFGNSLYHQGKYEHAEICYNKAIEADVRCLEAHYNLALVYRKTKQVDKSLGILKKLEFNMKMFQPLMVQIIKAYMSMGDNRKSLELLDNLINVTPKDPALLVEMSELAETQSDYSSMKILIDAYKCLPSHIKTIERLLAIYIHGKAYEKAIELLEDCASLRPDQDKWPMMIAACHRRSGDYHQAFNSYRKVHAKFPDNITCLKSLIQLCNDLGLDEAKLYTSKLNKIIKRSSTNQQSDIEKSEPSGSIIHSPQPTNVRNNYESKENSMMMNNINVNTSSSIGGKKSKFIEDDLLTITARPSTSDRRIGELDGESEYDEDPIINMRSSGRY